MQSADAGVLHYRVFTPQGALANSWLLMCCNGLETHLLPAVSVRVTHFFPKMSSSGTPERRHLKRHHRRLSACIGCGSSAGVSLAICRFILAITEGLQH